MKTLGLSNGDLTVGPTGHQTISGVPKIRQDVALTLGEEYQSDRFHPDMGSILIEFIGQAVDEETEMLIRAEVGRVVAQYIAIQAREVLRDHLAQRMSRFDASDVVTGILNIQAKIDFDTVRITAVLLTQAGAQVAVGRTVTV
jgi:phage baseplate assembly protein W